MTDPWEYDAACAEIGGDAWFAGLDDPAAANAAKKMCNTICPVRDECLQVALRDDHRDGVWGGMAAYERSRLRVTSNREGAA